MIISYNLYDAAFLKSLMIYFNDCFIFSSRLSGTFCIFQPFLPYHVIWCSNPKRTLHRFVAHFSPILKFLAKKMFDSISYFISSETQKF